MAAPTLPSSIEFVNEQEQEFFAEAVLGEDVKEFLTSPTGRYLHGCAKQEYDRCCNKLLQIDPYTPEGKRDWTKVNRDAAAAEMFMRWCVEMITRGDQAATMLENYREEA